MTKKYQWFYSYNNKFESLGFFDFLPDESETYLFGPNENYICSEIKENKAYFIRLT